MALKIRLRQQGRTNHLTYRLIVVDVRCPRDGKYIEMLGHYDPHLDNKRNLTLFDERIEFWLNRGAQMTLEAQHLITRQAPHIIKALREQQQKKKTKRIAKRKKKA